MKQRITLIIIILLGLSTETISQNRPSDMIKKEDRVGVTGMFKYVNNSWNNTRKSKYGDLNFDSFRIWAQTDIEDIFFASAQYRFYEGWNTPQYLYIGFHIKKTTLKIGQTWVPFGIEWQTFDDWGNIAFYTGFQDDYDYGATWTIPYNNYTFNLGFFKNQQLSSSSTWRYDADIYSGGINSGDDLIGVQKENEETNQFNIHAKYTFDIDGFTGNIGISGMGGQIYNVVADDFGSRLAGSVFASLDKGIFHFNVQNIFYDYKQVLAPGAPPSDGNFINMSCWTVSYEMPSKANIFSTSTEVNIIGEKLSYHVNYSLLSGGTSLVNSYILTSGFSSFLGPIDIFFEGYYGVSDPQFSGNVPG